MSDDDRETNRAHWDALAEVHGQDDYDDAEALVGGADSLGARVTGADFSPASLAKGRELAARACA